MSVIINGTPPLRQYQYDVVDRAAAQVGRGKRRGVIQSETGSGKTFCIAYLTRRAVDRNSSVLILADRRKLVDQAKGVVAQFGVEFGTVMAGKSEDTNRRVIIASRDTLSRWHEVDRTLCDFDLILTDECQKVPGDRYQKLLERYPAAASIGFSGTPARNDGKSLGDYYQWMECAVPASQLIREGYLLKPEVYAPKEMAERRARGDKIKGLAGDPVEHWLRHAENLPTIAFSQTIPGSMRLRDQFLGSGIAAEHIDASATDEQREEMYARLRTGETKVLASVGLLIEGIDIPEVSAAIMYAKFGSPVAYRQACGRIMRPAPWINKTRCVVLDHSGAAAVHGLPGEDVVWSLDMGSSVSSRRKAALKNDPSLNPVMCQACGLEYSGQPMCPSCGWVTPQVRDRRTVNAEKAQAVTDEILTRFSKGMLGPEELVRFQREWLKAISIAVAKGGTVGQASGIFRNRCKVYPEQVGVRPPPPGRSNWRQPAADAWPEFRRSKK